MFSLVIPIYGNQENIPRLLEALVALSAQFLSSLEVVFVIDGSPDASLEILRDRLPQLPLCSRVVVLSRNFGSFQAISAGLAQGEGQRFGVMAADLQEPPTLIVEFDRILGSGEADIVMGYRAHRDDPWLSHLLSAAFWTLYRRFVVKDIPRGGVDVFGCTREVRDHLLELREFNTNLIALLFWLGFRRQFVRYERQARIEGRSAWTFAKKFDYALSSVFNFTDLPIQLLLATGLIGTGLSVVASVVVLTAKLSGSIQVLGYVPIMLLISFFGGLTALGLGIIGEYLWLSLQNARQRPNFIVQSVQRYGGSTRSKDET